MSAVGLGLFIICVKKGYFYDLMQSFQLVI
jgi:hypothetical protein